MMSTPVSPCESVDLSCLKQYGFSQLQVEGPLGGGMFSQPLLLSTDRGKFLLRRHTFRSNIESFRFQAEATQWAHDRGVSCSTVYKTLDGDWGIELPESQCVLALHRFVEGSTLDWSTWHRLKESAPSFLVNLGVVVAQLHNCLSCAEPGGDPELSSSLPPMQFRFIREIHDHWNKCVEKLSADNQVLCRRSKSSLLSLMPRIQSHWDHLLSSLVIHLIDELPLQIVHGDVSAVNIVFDSNNSMAFIDWDCIHRGSRLYDALGDILNRYPHQQPELNRFRKTHVEAFLKGYSSALDQPLSSLELDLVPAFCLARQLEDLRQRLQVIPHLSEEHDETYSLLIGMRVEIMDQIRNQSREDWGRSLKIVQTESEEIAL